MYLNACSQGALSIDVRRAYEEYLRDWEEKGAPWDYWVERAETARASFAELINAAPNEVAVTASVSAGVNALMSAFRPDDERHKIVISDFEFPTVGQISHAQELRGWDVVHVGEADDATIPLEHFADVVDERTALVAVSHVCFRNGSRQDIGAITELAHERGALVLADSYQAAGAVPIDVRTSGVDFLTAGTVKYLLGSAGLAFFFARADRIEHLLPTTTGWFADEDIFKMDIRDYSPSHTARRFEAGTPPVPNIYAGIAGLEIVKSVGVHAIHEHVRELNELLIAGVDELGGRVVTPRDPAKRAALIAIASTDEHALVDALAKEGIITSSRDGNLRVSAHLYNSAEDMETLLGALRKHATLLR